MHITIVCPSCQNSYQVDAHLQGQRMRCPNPVCRQVFEVKALSLAPLEKAGDGKEGKEKPTPSTKPHQGPMVPPEAFHQSGSVGDIIPILTAVEAAPSQVPLPPAKLADDIPVLEAEALPPAEAPPPTNAPAWQSAPPPRRRDATPENKAPAPEPKTTPPARKVARPPKKSRSVPESDEARAPREGIPVPERRRRSAETMSEASGQPVVLPPGAWEAPPVRRGAGAETSPLSEEPRSAAAAPARRESEYYHAPSRRRAWLFMAGIALVVTAILGSAGWYVWTHVVESESREREQAQRDYDEGRYLDAANRFRKLSEKFSDSSDAPQYEFMSQVSQIQSDLQGVGTDPQAQLTKVSQFLKKQEKSPLLKPHGPALGKSLVRLLTDFAGGGAGKGDPADLPILERAEQILTEMDQRLPGSISAADRAKVTEAFQNFRAAAALKEKQQRLFARLRELAAAPSGEAVKQAHQLIQQEALTQPGIERDATVQQLLVQLYEGHRNQIGFLPAVVDLNPPSGEKTTVEPSLLIDQLIAGKPGPIPAEDRIVLALARGVLYALLQSTGEVKWAMRVGIDTTDLPVRLPATLANPEMFLVLSADTNLLTARDTEGQSIWEHRLPAPCLGRPIIVNQRAYLSTYDGQVHEIELARGHLLGRFKLGQRLTQGGVRQPGTYNLFFAADDTCIYSLNVDPRLDPALRKCEAILYSGHPSGSLRSEPILATWNDANAAGPQGYLILPRAHGLDGMELQTFDLPIQDPNARPLTMQPPPQTRGWTWFPPYHDPEKIALSTDAGLLDLFGIRQLRNQDNPLFRFIHDETLSSGGTSFDLGHRSRSQIVHVQENDFWVLAEGQLQRRRLTFDRKAGPRMVPVWSKPLALGSPLHISQVDESTSGMGLGLLVVTQSLGRQTCLATMVDAEEGRIRWQRQLGLVCQGEAFHVQNEVVALDQGGGLFRFDPGQHTHRQEVPWQVGGQILARPVEGLASSRPYLLQALDGKSVYEVAPEGKGTRVILRHYQPSQEKKSQVVEHAVELRKPLAGAPALGEEGLLLPLADGSIYRLHLPLDGTAGVDGPDWRAGRPPLDLQPYVVWLSKDEFLTTDGGRGLTRWRWPRGDVWQALPKNKDPRSPTVELPARIIAAPVVISAGPEGERQICVADAEGRLSLLGVKGEGLVTLHHWEMKGKITAGPFLIGKNLGCVVDRRRLVWLDPKKEGALWEHKSDGEELVGQPQLIENLLVIADQSGQFLGLDPETGKRWPGYRMKASVAAAAPPVTFGPGRLFAPLTDGTVFLLSLDCVRDPLRQFPTSW